MYKVLAAMHEDMNQGWAWLTGSEFVPRSIVKITNSANNKSVYLERLEIDDNFTKEYNQAPRVYIEPAEETAIINAWYRKRLGGIATKTSHDLKVVETNGWWARFRANTGHPQAVVRLAMWLAIISVALGLAGVGLGVLSVCLAFK